MLAGSGKVCRKCGETKDLSAYRRETRTPDGHQRYCKACSNAASVTSHRKSAAYKDTQRDSHYRRKYGISLADYDTLFASQGGACASCRRPNLDGKPLHVDHCHATGRVRALLCQSCNMMLGMADDIPEYLEAGAAYLRLHAPAH